MRAQYDAAAGFLEGTQVSRDASLRLGMFGSARIAGDQTAPATIVVPRAAVVELDGKSVVFVRSGDGGFERREVHTLSGGQAQRVALARAIVNRPRVLLFDEPLSALDLQIRRELQVELKDMLRELQGTFVYVTHDQEEAMSMSDRVVVMRLGEIEQVGSPVELYRSPASLFVASFVGSSNVIPVKALRMDDGSIAVELGGTVVRATASEGVVPGADAALVLRAESISPSADASPTCGSSARWSITAWTWRERGCTLSSPPRVRCSKRAPTWTCPGAWRRRSCCRAGAM